MSTLIISIVTLVLLIIIIIIAVQKSKSNRIKNIYSKDEAEVVILIGSESGTTQIFAQKVYQQFIDQSVKTYITTLNDYDSFDSVKYLLVFSATSGMGSSPTNADQFSSLINMISQDHPVKYSLIGFGSSSYPEFCGYADELEELFAEAEWAEMLISLKKVNDKSTNDFIKWVKEWNRVSDYKLTEETSYYQQGKPALETFVVTQKINPDNNEEVFIIRLKAPETQVFESGDLLVVYPKEDLTERFYSIGKFDNEIQLVVKIHENGAGSNYLYNLKVGDEIQARVVENTSFHYPKTNQNVLMISNGTGIAPFLGMIAERNTPASISLYGGFRVPTSFTNEYEKNLIIAKEKQQLSHFEFCYSRALQKCYVLDLIKRDEHIILETLKNKGHIMICGLISMQNDVVKILEEVIQKNDLPSMAYYTLNNYIHMDCY